MKHIKLDWAEIKHLAHHPQSLTLEPVYTADHSQPLTLEHMLQKHEGVFKEELETLKGFQATILVPDNAAPRFYRPRSVPYTTKPKVHQAEAFRRSKDLLKSADVLVHYSGERPLILACDSSPYGVGALVSHRMEDGTEKTIGFVSCTLAPAKKKYSQLDKKGLAVIFGIKRFHIYLCGRNFTIVTDQKPLISLFNETKPVPQMVSPRVQRWSVWLRAYEYHIVYQPGIQCLSRLPLPETLPAEEEEDLVLMLDGMDDAPVATEQVKHWPAKDATVSHVQEYVLKGWPSIVEHKFMPYFTRRLELSVRDGCVLWGAGVNIPQKGRTTLLKLLHQPHPGISQMKELARSVCLVATDGSVG